MAERSKGGGNMEGEKDMGMTNKQFQGFIRLMLALIKQALKDTPDNEILKTLQEACQSMLEDGTD